MGRREGRGTTARRVRAHRTDQGDVRVARLHAPEDARAPAPQRPDRRALLLGRAHRAAGGARVIFRPTNLAGAFVVELEERSDDRGFFARSFCMREFEEHGLKPTVAQCNVSFNHKAGTMRGMHYQLPPAAETKLVRCTRGAIYDVIVDLRQDSPTYLQHFGVELTETNRHALYVPEMFAHGYL